MISALDRAFSEIHANIPPEILETAFMSDGPHNVSVDEKIRQEVILKRVRDDISVRGGKLKYITLRAEWGHFSSAPLGSGVSPGGMTFLIPPEAREFRDISAALETSFPYQLSASQNSVLTNFCARNSTNLTSLAQAALQSQTGGVQITYPSPVVYEGNVLGFNPPQSAFSPWQILVRLRYDDNFSGMDVSLIRPFVILCREAVRNYIYINLIMKIESNAVMRGADIGAMKDIVSSYSDANEKYEEGLLQLGGAEFFDPVRQRNLLIKMVQAI